MADKKLTKQSIGVGVAGTGFIGPAHIEGLRRNGIQVLGLAEQIYNLLNGRVFVAHNVSFDYSFVHYLLGRSGFQWSAPKLCTIKLSRRVFPGLVKYGLGSLTRDLGIKIEGRHRAWGDAAATAQVLTMAIEKEGMQPIHNLLAKKEPRKKIVPRTEMPNDRSDAED